MNTASVATCLDAGLCRVCDSDCTGRFQCQECGLCGHCGHGSACSRSRVSVDLSARPGVCPLERDKPARRTEQDYR
jgi:hypothetical protein